MPLLIKPTRVIIHCSASPNGRADTIDDIDRWHAQRGFRRDPTLIGANRPDLKHVGYHFVIAVSGSVDIGRGEREIGAHVAGWNAHSLGVCLVGTDAFSAAQWESLRALLFGSRGSVAEPNPNGLLGRHGLDAGAVCGHRDLPDVHKTCPGFDVHSWIAGGCVPLAGHVFGDAP